MMRLKDRGSKWKKRRQWVIFSNLWNIHCCPHTFWIINFRYLQFQNSKKNQFWFKTWLSKFFSSWFERGGESHRILAVKRENCWLTPVSVTKMIDLCVNKFHLMMECKHPIKMKAKNDPTITADCWIGINIDFVADCWVSSNAIIRS